MKKTLLLFCIIAICGACEWYDAYDPCVCTETECLYEACPYCHSAPNDSIANVECLHGKQF